MSLVVKRCAEKLLFTVEEGLCPVDGRDFQTNHESKYWLKPLLVTNLGLCNLRI